MRNSRTIQKNFDFYIDEYMYNCKSRRLRKKTMESYEQSLRLFERWVEETENIQNPEEVTEQIIRHYISDLQDRGKYSFYANEEQTSTNYPYRRRDYRQPVSPVTINNYIRNLRAFFNWFSGDLPGRGNPMERIRQIKVERKEKTEADTKIRNRLRG